MSNPNKEAQVCPYCGAQTCAMFTGSTICEPALYGVKTVTREFADLIRKEWGDSWADTLEVVEKPEKDS